MEKLKQYIQAAIASVWIVFFGSLGIFGFSFIPVQFAPFTDKMIENLAKEGFSHEAITFSVAIHTTLIALLIAFVAIRFVFWSFKKPSSLHAQGISFLFVGAFPYLFSLFLFRSVLSPAYHPNTYEIIASISMLFLFLAILASAFPVIAEHYRRAVIAEANGGILPESEKKDIDTENTTFKEDLKATYTILFRQENKITMRYCAIGMFLSILPILITFFLIR